MHKYSHSELLKKATRAINSVHQDRSVNLATTYSSLEELSEHIGFLKEMVEKDIRVLADRERLDASAKRYKEANRVHR